MGESLGTGLGGREPISSVERLLQFEKALNFFDLSYRIFHFIFFLFFFLHERMRGSLFPTLWVSSCCAHMCVCVCMWCGRKGGNNNNNNNNNMTEKEAGSKKKKSRGRSLNSQANERSI